MFTVLCDLKFKVSN